MMGLRRNKNRAQKLA